MIFLLETTTPSLLLHHSHQLGRARAFDEAADDFGVEFSLGELDPGVQRVRVVVG